MSDTAEIDYVSKIDFSKGFQSFHIKWSLKDLTKPKESAIFETVVTDGDQSITLKWSLGVQDSPRDPTKMWFGIYFKSSGKISPMIYRICLSSATNVLFDSSYFVVMDGNLGYGHSVSSSDVDAYPIKDLVIQFWMDIPNAIAIANNSRKLIEAKGDFQGQNSMQKASNDVFFLDHAKMVSRVMGAGPDPSSDVSVIVVKKKEEGKEEEEEEELRRFNCHTIFLSSRSDVFETMFASEKWKENSVKDGRSVRIKDVSARDMETVLQYIYTSTLPDPSIDHDYLCGIIFAADIYNLQELKNWCVSILIRKHTSIKCRIEQLILADRHNLSQLKSVCIDQLSFGFSSFSDQAILKNVSIELWSEMFKAMSDRQVKTTHITLSAA